MSSLRSFSSRNLWSSGVPSNRMWDGKPFRWYFFGFGSNILLFIISDFFSPVESIRNLYIYFGYVVIIFGSLFFSYYAEREIKQESHILTAILTLILGFLILDIFILIVPPVFFTIAFAIPFYILILSYMVKFTSIIKEKWRLNIYGSIFGVFFVLLGYAFNMDLMVNMLGYISRLIGDVCIATGISSISLLFVGLPSLNEFEWPNKMKKLFLMYKNGAYITDYNFQENLPEKDQVKDLSHLIADGLTSLNKIISGIVQSKQKLKIIDHKDIKIIFHIKWKQNKI